MLLRGIVRARMRSVAIVVLLGGRSLACVTSARTAINDLVTGVFTVPDDLAIGVIDLTPGYCPQIKFIGRYAIMLNAL